MANENVVRINLNELDFDPTFNGRIDPNSKAVEKYLDSIEYLPPIRVWANPDFNQELPLKPSTSREVGNMPFKVLDGVQRTSAYRAAAKHGKKQYETIPAIIEQVSREDAQSIGLTANMTSALPLTLEERDGCVMKFLSLNAELGEREAARQLSLTHPTIIRIKRVDGLYKTAARNLDEYAKQRIVAKMPDRSTLHGLAEIPEKYRKRVLENVMTRGWSRRNISAARNILSKRDVTDAEVEAALTAEIPESARKMTLAQYVETTQLLLDELVAANDEGVTAESVMMAATLADNCEKAAKLLQAMIDNWKLKYAHQEHAE